MQIEFLKPARMDDVLEVVTETEEVRGASITLHQQVMRGDEVADRRPCEGGVRVRRPRAPDPEAAARSPCGADQERGRRPERPPRPVRRAQCRRAVDAAPAAHVRTIHMSWSKDSGRSGPRGYHHGNLKEALLRAALELIAKKGPAGFTFAEAARWAGVSPAAPYRHFRDRDELLSNVALRGFQQFEAALAKAWDDGRPDPLTAFDRLGKAYLAFARTEPAYYSAMFEAGIPLDANPELREAGDRAFAVLRNATERLVATLPASSRPPVADDGAAHLGDGARHRVAVRPRRCRAPDVADDARGAAGGRGPDLSARARPAGRPAASPQALKSSARSSGTGHSESGPATLPSGRRSPA